MQPHSTHVSSEREPVGAVWSGEWTVQTNTVRPAGRGSLQHHAQGRARRTQQDQTRRETLYSRVVSVSIHEIRDVSFFASFDHVIALQCTLKLCSDQANTKAKNFFDLFHLFLIFFAFAWCGWALTFAKTSHLPPANEVWGKVISSVACVKNYSVHGGGGGGLPQCMLGYHPPRADPPRADMSPPGGDPQDQASPCAVHAGRYGQQPGIMHPTGMKSCYPCVVLC